MKTARWLKKEITVELACISKLLSKMSSIDRPNEMLSIIYTSLADEETFYLWPAIFLVWSGFDAVPHAEYELVFSLLPPRPQELVAHIPSAFTIFRGQDKEDKVGLSWTTDIDVARAFAAGHRGIRNSNPVVLVATVQREDVAFTCDDRSEAEVVLLKAPTAYDVLAQLGCHGTTT